MVVHRVVDACDDQCGAFLPRRKAGCGVAAADLGLDGVELADEGHAFLGDWRGPGAGDLNQLAAGMGPTVGQLDTGADAVRRDQTVVADIPIDLQDAAEALQDPFAVLPAPTGGIDEG